MDVRTVIPKDAIPSIDDPTFGTAYVGEDDDEVIVVDGDQPRAYPIRILSYHEIVNDVVDGEPLAVTWCPLCGSAVVYERTVGGRTLTFGVSGKLADDDLVMYDRETDSEWKQSLGECLTGAYEGSTLAVHPAPVSTWARFREAHTDGVVLQPPGGVSEAASDTDEPAAVDYTMEPYERYFEAERFGLDAHRGDGGRRWDRDDDIEAKTVVLGVVVDGEAVGFPLPRVEANGGVVEATVGGVDVVVVATDDGGVAVEDPGFDLALIEDPGVDLGQTEGLASVVSGDGATWEPTTGRSDDDRTLTPVPTRRLFAFAWQDDHGPNAFWPGTE